MQSNFSLPSLKCFVRKGERIKNKTWKQRKRIICLRRFGTTLCNQVTENRGDGVTQDKTATLAVINSSLPSPLHSICKRELQDRRNTLYQTSIELSFNKKPTEL